MKVLITNGDNLRALIFTRALAKHKDIELHVSAERHFAATFFSRVKTKRLINVNPKKDPKRFLKQIKDYVNKHKIDILIPVNSDEITLILKNRNQFKCKIPYPEFNLLDRMRDKWEFYQMLKKINIPTPLTTKGTKIILPAIVKQRRGAGSKGVTKVTTIDQLKAAIKDTKKKYKTAIVQEYIKGTSYGAAAINGKVMVYKNIRQYPIKHGTGTCRISVHNETIEKQIKKILKHLKWEGIAQFDIIENDNTYYVIEMNPRLYSSLNVTTKSGFNLPYAWVTGKKLTDYKDNTICKVLLDIYVKHKTKTKTPKGKVFFDDLDLKDPLPSIPLFVKTIRGKLL